MEACPLWKCCSVSYYYHLLLLLLLWQWFSFTLTLYHKIHELFYLWCQTNLKLQEKLCNKCPSGNSSKTAVIVTFLARSLALHRTTEAQEALWHLTSQSNYHQPEHHYTKEQLWAGDTEKRSITLNYAKLVPVVFSHFLKFHLRNLLQNIKKHTINWIK